MVSYLHDHHQAPHLLCRHAPHHDRHDRCFGLDSLRPGLCTVGVVVNDVLRHRVRSLYCGVRG